MAATEPIDLIFWGNILAGSGLILYSIFLWLQARGHYVPPARLAKIIKYSCFALLSMPLVARFHYPEQLILYFSVFILLVGLLIKIRGFLGK